MQPFFMPKNFTIKIEDTIGYWPNTKKNVSAVLDQNKGKEVAVRMSSLGGKLDDGLGMMNYFKDHGNVTCYLYEFNASATTIAAMGAKKTLMDKNSFYLIHKCSNFVLEWGTMNSDEMQEAIERITKDKEDNDKIDEIMVAIYMQKTNLPADKIMDLMKREAWLTATEALTLGFVDGLIEDESANPDSKTASISKSQVAKFNSFGVKLPPLPVEATVDPFASAVDRILSFFKPKEKESAVKPIITMSKEFKEVSAILGVDALELTDGKLNLSEEQLQNINASIEASSQNLVNKEAEIEELKTQIEALKGKPGDVTTDPDPLDGDGKENNLFTRAGDMLASVENL